MKIILVLFLILLFIPVVFSVEGKKECMNSTHLSTILEWTKCDPSCTTYNVTQTMNCTYGCDTVNNVCKYSGTESTANIAAVFITGIISIVLLFFGFRIGSRETIEGIKERFFMSAIKLTFVMIGMWLILLSIGLAVATVESSGASETVVSLSNRVLIVVTYGIYLFMVIFFLGFLYTVLMTLAESGKRK
ncbi:MAG: hypothetical protein GTN76_02310 [Candidatus Aenigmarchaeota archaeon]|nr:hypothetical protein [Candidatus Aenigmarchaeota archaeon]